VAISGVGNRIGSAVTPVYAQILVSAAGWRAAVVAVGIMVWAVSLVPSALFLRRQPEDMGLHPDGVSDEEATARRERTAPGTASLGVRDISYTLAEVLRMPSFYLLAVGLTLGFMVAVTTSLHIIPHLSDTGLTPEEAVTVMSVSAIAGALGSLAFGFVAERVTSRVAVIANAVISAVSFVWLLTVDSFPMAMAWGIVYGVVLGGTFILHQIVMADYFGRGSLGTIRGVMLPFQSIMQAAGPVAAGLAYDVTNTYSLVFGLFVALSAAAALLVFASRPPTQRATNIGPRHASEN
jgi:sugar phosphate permease